MFFLESRTSVSRSIAAREMTKSNFVEISSMRACKNSTLLRLIEFATS